jgi:hypothetical protein
MTGSLRLLYWEIVVLAKLTSYQGFAMIDSHKRIWQR